MHPDLVDAIKTRHLQHRREKWSKNDSSLQKRRKERAAQNLQKPKITLTMTSIPDNCLHSAQLTHPASQKNLLVRSTSNDQILHCNICDENISKCNIHDHLITQHREEYQSSRSIHPIASTSTPDQIDAQQRTAAAPQRIPVKPKIVKITKVTKKPSKVPSSFKCKLCGETHFGTKKKSYEHLLENHTEQYRNTYRWDYANNFEYKF